MDVTVDVAGEGTYEVSLEGPADGPDADGPDVDGAAADAPTYADVCAAIGYSTHEVSVLVDGRPVPEDRPVEAERVTVLRLVQGG